MSTENKPIVAKKSIYNIQQEYLDLMAEIEYYEGDLTPELAERLSINKEELETKSVNYGYVIRDNDFTVAQIDAEIERLTKIKKAKENATERLKITIADAMKAHGIEKVTNNNLTLSFRKSKVLVIEEGAKIPKKFIKKKITETADKTELKKAIEAGKTFLGIRIQENQNLQIK